MKHKAVLFDLDGTLLDTLDDLADSMNAVLAGMGLPIHPTGAYRRFVGEGVRMLAARALPETDRGPEAVSHAIAAMREQYARRWDHKSRPYDGVPELLAALAGRGVRGAVLSNKPDDFTKLCVSKLLPDARFDVVQGVCETCPPKPDPAGARSVCEAMNVPPTGFVYLGDTNTDMCTAVAAGMEPVGALWGFRSADELRESGAKTLIDRPGELLSVLR